MFAPDGLANASRLYRTKVYPTGKIIIDTSYFPELAQQHCLRTGAQLFSIVYPQSMHFPCRHRSYSPETLYRQTCYKPQSLVGMNGAQAIRLTVIGCYFGKEFIIGNSRRCHQAQPFTYFPFYFFGYIHSQGHTRLVFRHIQKSLIQRDRLYDIRILMENLMYPAGYRFIHIHAPRNENKLRTQPLRFL